MEIYGPDRAMSAEDYSRFQNLSYEKFREMATDPTLSEHERVGFPDSYRAEFEASIFADIRLKLPCLEEKGRRLLDVGPGASGLPRSLIEPCRRNDHRLALIDSAEMLSQLPDAPFVSKIAGRFPVECDAFIAAHAGQLDGILTYSVLQYIFAESSVHAFVDRLLMLLAPQGRILIGDIPNVSKRKRFFSSAEGIRHHQRFTGTNEIPCVQFNAVDPGQIDDAVVLALLARCRSSGFDAYVVPQGSLLPMANRREDILIIRP
jgi:hypothetical protein